MNPLIKKVLGIVLGLLLFIAIMEIKSWIGGRSSGHHPPPITQEDADLYMSVMRQTAARVKNPPPEDIAVVDAFNRIPNARTAAADQLTDEQRKTIMDALRITETLDGVVAEEMQVDQSRYERAKEAVEEIFPPPSQEHPPASNGPTETRRKALDSYAKVLAPHADEFLKIQEEIYNNPLRKTVKGE
jgi:hypothetical protein